MGRRFSVFGVELGVGAVGFGSRPAACRRGPGGSVRSRRARDEEAFGPARIDSIRHRDSRPIPLSRLLLFLCCCELGLLFVQSLAVARVLVRLDPAYPTRVSPAFKFVSSIST